MNFGYVTVNGVNSNVWKLFYSLCVPLTTLIPRSSTGNLDSKTSQDVLSLLKVTSQKFAQTIVMITHNEEIAQMADRIIRIEDGRIVSQN